MRGRPLRALAFAAGSLVLLTAGCDAGTTPAPVGKAALEKPATPAVAAPAAGSATTPLDWKSPAYAALGCAPRAEWVAQGLPADAWDARTVRTTFADVTGDGTDEALVQVTCPAAVSSHADHVVVFDVTTARPRLLGVLGDDLVHPRAEVATEGTTVTLSGPTVGDDDPHCCPGHWGTVTYAWDGAAFVVRSRSEVPGTQPAGGGRLADGEHVGVLLSVGDDEVSVLVLDWFEGADAVAACREDGVENHGTAWCNEYYARDGGRTTTVPVSASASLSYLDLGTMEDVAVGQVAALAGTYWVSEDPEGAGYTRFRTGDGEITELASIYTP
ncbi:LppP/LprE lipoprotein [Blastococcus aurantiacus]|uniref:LppP/LprE lipoprotein n=2 Tax=Blastococcus aurantiacus TaxID=1550231 RepID=A0A1G7J8Z6_9ACTN|nr:LppP/LprE lipoprotein [Blastococcus aurantiacus]